MLALATSVTWMKSRRCRPSSNTCGGGCFAAAAEDAGNPGVGGVPWHPRAVDVVVAQRYHVGSGGAGDGGAEVFSVSFGGRVHVSWIQGRRRVDRCRGDCVPTDRARRLEPMAVQVLGTTV